MIRSKSAASIALLLPLVFACNDSEHQRQLAELQKKADDRVAKVEKDARERVSQLEKQIEVMKADFADSAAKAKAEAEGAISEAKASADEEKALADHALAKARQAFKAEGKAQLAAANKDLNELGQRIGKATAAVKSGVMPTMQKIEALEKTINQDIAAYDAASLDTFAAAKAKLTRDLAELKQLIAAGKAKVPAT